MCTFLLFPPRHTLPLNCSVLFGSICQNSAVSSVLNIPDSEKLSEIFAHSSVNHISVSLVLTTLLSHGRFFPMVLWRLIRCFQPLPPMNLSSPRATASHLAFSTSIGPSTGMHWHVFKNQAYKAFLTFSKVETHAQRAPRGLDCTAFSLTLALFLRVVLGVL